MSFKDAISQIIKLLVAILALIPLAGFVSIMFPPFGHLPLSTLGTTNTFRPPQFAHFDITFLIVNQILNVQHLCSPSLICSLHLAYDFTSPFANYLLVSHIEP